MQINVKTNFREIASAFDSYGKEIDRAATIAINDAAKRGSSKAKEFQSDAVKPAAGSKRLINNKIAYTRANSRTMAATIYFNNKAIRFHQTEKATVSRRGKGGTYTATFRGKKIKAFKKGRGKKSPLLHRSNGTTKKLYSFMLLHEVEKHDVRDRVADIATNIAVETFIKKLKSVF